VQVDVVDLLPAVAVAVHDEAVAVLGDPGIGRQLAGHGEHAAERQLVIGLHVVDGGDQHVGHDQDMGLGLGLDVAKGGHQLVLIKDVGGDLFADDFADAALVRQV